MTIIMRLGHPRQHRRSRPEAIPGPNLTLSGPPSYLLRPLVADLGGAWPAHAVRCRRELPAELAWAAPLLNSEHPLTVLWGREQACALMVWHNHLPTYEQLSFSCERKTRPAGPARG